MREMLSVQRSFAPGCSVFVPDSAIRGFASVFLLLALLLAVGGLALATPAVGVSQRIGFHQFAVGVASGLGSANEMQTWWNDSPYFDVGFYANGAANHPHQDDNLDSDWVTAAQGYGWGLMPIWTGEQAPCTSWTYTLSWDPTTAASQGALEAGLAIASVGNESGGLGLAGTIIYFDMEPYTATSTNPDNPSEKCGAAVVAFLNGWIAGLQSNGYYAGVYGSPADAYDVTRTTFSDWTSLSTSPDDVWMSYVPHLSHDTVTVWNIKGGGYNVPDSQWGDSQRLAQYTVDDPGDSRPCCDETWGDVPFHIDKDIEDGQVIVGATYKTYSFDQQESFEAGTNTAQTVPQGITGISDGKFDSGTLPADEIGDLIVGWWFANAGGPSGNFGFVYDSIADDFRYSSVDCDSTESTQLLAVNNAGLAIGFDDSGPVTFNATTGHSGSGTCNSDPLPFSCSDCEAFGVNDAGWIVGASDVDFDDSQGFVFKPGQTEPLTLDLGVWNEITGVNGQGIVTGYYSPDDDSIYGFTADASQDTITVLEDSIVCPSMDYEAVFPGAINNNGQVVGYSFGGAPPDGFWFDANGCQDLATSFNGEEGGIAYSLNDLAQIVGQALGQTSNAAVLLPTVP